MLLSNPLDLNLQEGFQNQQEGYSRPNFSNHAQTKSCPFTRLESGSRNGSWSEGLCRNFSDEEIYRFFEVIGNPKDKMCFQLQAFLGLRIGEAVRVNIRNINWNQRRMLVENIKGKRVNYVFLHDLIIQEIIKYTNKHKRKITKHNGYLVYSANRATKRDFISEDHIRKCFRQYCRAIDLDDVYVEIPAVEGQMGDTKKLHRLTTHSLRHWFITKVWRETKDPVLTQRLARHTNFNVTQNYINLDEQDEIRTLQGLFGN